MLAEEFPKQIDVAYEGVGGELRDAILSNLAHGGRVLAVGYISSYPHNDRGYKTSSFSFAEYLLSLRSSCPGKACIVSSRFIFM